VTLGYAEDGKRRKRKVSGQTKAAVVDKLRELHKTLEEGIVPKTGYAHYTVRQAAEEWLAHGPSKAPPAVRRGLPGAG
jgi:hypothetical protein